MMWEKGILGDLQLHKLWWEVYSWMGKSFASGDWSFHSLSEIRTTGDTLWMGWRLFEGVLHVVPLYNMAVLCILAGKYFLCEKLVFVSNHSCHGSLKVPWLQRHCLRYINIVHKYCTLWWLLWYTHTSWYNGICTIIIGQLCCSDLYVKPSTFN